MKHFFSRITFPSPSPGVPERVEFWIWRPDGSSIAMLSSGDPKQDEAEAAAMVEGLNQFLNPSKKCDKCNSKDAEQEHTCPYAEEINDDHETMCNCCSDCAHECCMDI